MKNRALEGEVNCTEVINQVKTKLKEAGIKFILRDWQYKVSHIDGAKYVKLLPRVDFAWDIGTGTVTKIKMTIKFVLCAMMAKT